MTARSETAEYFAFARGVAAAIAAGDEAALDDNLSELALIAGYGTSRACREGAARLVSQHRYFERIAERDTAQLDAARDGLAIALANGEARKANAWIEALEALTEEGLARVTRVAARRALDRHFKAYGATIQPRH